MTSHSGINLLQDQGRIRWEDWGSDRCRRPLRADAAAVGRGSPDLAHLVARRLLAPISLWLARAGHSTGSHRERAGAALAAGLRAPEATPDRVTLGLRTPASSCGTTPPGSPEKPRHGCPAPIRGGSN